MNTATVTAEACFTSDVIHPLHHPAGPGLICRSTTRPYPGAQPFAEPDAQPDTIPPAQPGRQEQTWWIPAPADQVETLALRTRHRGITGAVLAMPDPAPAPDPASAAARGERRPTDGPPQLTRTDLLADKSAASGPLADARGWWLGLAGVFGAHLQLVRASRGWHGSFITSPSAPITPPGAIRVPHLLSTDAALTTALRPGPGSCVPDPDAVVGGVVAAGHAGRPAGDAVVWELLPAGLALAWLGEPLPDQDLVEQQLPRLQQLRQATRHGRYPRSRAGRQLQQVLQDRYLSIRLVYQHQPLINAVLADLSELAPPTPPAAGHHHASKGDPRT